MGRRPRAWARGERVPLFGNSGSLGWRVLQASVVLLSHGGVGAFPSPSLLLRIFVRQLGPGVAVKPLVVVVFRWRARSVAAFFSSCNLAPPVISPRHWTVRSAFRVWARDRGPFPLVRTAEAGSKSVLVLKTVSCSRGAPVLASVDLVFVSLARF